MFSLQEGDETPWEELDDQQISNDGTDSIGKIEPFSRGEGVDSADPPPSTPPLNIIKDENGAPCPTISAPLSESLVPPRYGNVDQIPDNYNELGSSIPERLGSPLRQDSGIDSPGPRIDPQDDSRMDARADHHFDNRQPPKGLGRRATRYRNIDPTEPYTHPDRLAAQGELSGPPTARTLRRSQTAPDVSNLDRRVQLRDARRNTQPDNPRPRSPNKLHNSPSKPTSLIGVQSQTITTSNGGQIDPDALPLFPSPRGPETALVTVSLQDCTSYSSEGSYRPPKTIAEKPKLTFALLDEYRRAAEEHPGDPAIQLDYAMALNAASTVLIPMGGDLIRIAKSRENFNSEAYKIIKKLASPVFPLPKHVLMIGSRRIQRTIL